MAGSKNICVGCGYATGNVVCDRWMSQATGNMAGLKLKSCTRTQSCTYGFI